METLSGTTLHYPTTDINRLGIEPKGIFSIKRIASETFIVDCSSIINVDFYFAWSSRYTSSIKDTSGGSISNGEDVGEWVESILLNDQIFIDVVGNAPSYNQSHASLDFDGSEGMRIPGGSNAFTWFDNTIYLVYTKDANNGGALLDRSKNEGINTFSLFSRTGNNRLRMRFWDNGGIVSTIKTTSQPNGSSSVT